METARQIQHYLHTGDPAVAEGIFAPHQQPLFNYLRGFLPRHHDAEDALQETLYRALRALPTYRESNQFRAWLYRIAHNVALSLLRRDQRRQTDLDPDLDLKNQSLESSPSDRDDLAHLERAITALPDTEREVLILRIRSDLSFREIAELTSAPLNTVLGRMHKARHRLKEALNNPTP